VIQELKTGIAGWQNWVTAAGSENVFFAYLKTQKQYEGKSLAELAASNNIEPEQFLVDVMLEEHGDAFVILHMMSEEDLLRIMKKPYCMFGTDGTPIREMPHPRLYGTFSRVLGKYVRNDGILTLTDAIRKMTSLPAQRMGLRDRGMIREGMWADIAVFDPLTITDNATFSKPKQYPTGIEYVLVNGAIAVRRGQFAGICAGKVLRRS
jgi:N-acyl-D-amino-acid deacylase